MVSKSLKSDEVSRVLLFLDDELLRTEDLLHSTLMAAVPANFLAPSSQVFV